MSSIESVLSGADRHHVECCRAEDFCDRLPNGCIQLVAVDHPYFGVKDDDWDNAWPTVDGFLDWTSEMLLRYRRVLAPNGSLYVFARPNAEPGTATIGSLVEQRVAEHFQVLCNIRWRKPPHSTRAEMFRKEDLRSPFPASEVVIFAEQRGSDATAMGVAGYESQCAIAKQSVFGDYLRAEMGRAGVTNKAVSAIFPSRTGGLTGCVSNWLRGLNCPTSEQYSAIRQLLNASGGEFLRREYEDLRREYEDLRRPFSVSSDVPYTDVWDYATVGHYDGKHVCEKPWKMGLDIVRASSRDNDVVLDCFAGSGTFPAAAVALGRRVIACDMDPHWADVTRARCARAAERPELARRNPRKPMPSVAEQGDLFSIIAPT